MRHKMYQFDFFTGNHPLLSENFNDRVHLVIADDRYHGGCFFQILSHQAEDQTVYGIPALLGADTAYRAFQFLETFVHAIKPLIDCFKSFVHAVKPFIHFIKALADRLYLSLIISVSISLNSISMASPPVSVYRITDSV